MVSSGQTAEPARISTAVRSACDRLFETSQAARYGLSPDSFRTTLADIVEQYAPAASENEVVRFLDTLKAEELALARGCVEGNEFSWQTFLSRYRASLYGAAYSIAKEESIARELADSLYAELYGLPNESGRRISKLQYYKGRGSLEGWLRTVVAQEFVNRYRRTRHEVSLEEKVEAGAQFSATDIRGSESIADPRVSKAVAFALGELETESRLILNSYYLDGRTLAEIGRVFHVHESTISRKLERATKALRKMIKKQLLAQGMGGRQADELMQETDVRDLNVNIRENLQQESSKTAFYKSTEE
ncbi:MAG: sigma-70 family RNA polymerase sigma factor [Terriglobia bacterium]|jgi:RNA polymerase sigma-70 factor (ECF subfamily)|nr:sigma-70 family RNA polymerase sigma factor [Terriglobia bacterium]